MNMVIKDKKGKVYKLRGPNPIMKDQKKWDMAKLQFINMGWKNEVVVDERNPIQKFKTDFNVVDIGQELGLMPNEEAATVVKPQEFIDDIQETVVVEEPKEESKEEPVVLNVDSQLAKLIKERGVEYYCAPVVGKKEHVDALYDTSYYTMQYGEKFVFDAIIVEESDLTLQFWCVRPVIIDSIVFRKIVKSLGERWWRVKEVEPKTGGYLCRAITSDTNPDFS